MTGAAIPPIRASVVVPLAAAEAFRLFSERMHEWWPRQETWAKEELAEIIFEPGRGGRWYETDTAGTRRDYGDILAWQPPERVLVGWQMTPDYAPEPDPAKASVLEAQFLQIEPGTTRVEIEHRDFGRHGAGAARLHEDLSGPQGWPRFMNCYADLAKRIQSS